MTQFRVMAAAAAITGLVAIPAAAQGRSGTHGGGATTHGTSSTSGSTTTHGKSGDTTHGKSGDVSHGKSGDTDNDATEHHPSHDGSATHTVGSTDIATKISKNPQQLARITGMLPAGMTLDQATAGFRNQGQFIAALNASKNQHIPFADLQKAMTTDGLSLGEAVRKLRPTPPPTTTTTGTTSSTSTTTKS